MDIIKNQDPVGNISSGSGRVVISPEIGPTLHGVLLELGGTAFTKAMITGIRGKINRKVVYEITGSRLDKMNDYKGGASDAAYLLIDLTEHQAKDIASEMAGVWGTAAGVTELTFEIDVAGATAPTLASYSIVSGPQPLSQNIHTLEAGTLSVNAAGNHTLQLPRAIDSAGGPGRMIKRVWLCSTIVTAVTAKKNGMVRHETTRAVNEFLQQHYEGDPDASFYCVDYVLANNTLPEILRTDDANSNLLVVTTNAGGNIEYYIEGLASVDNIGAVR